MAQPPITRRVNREDIPAAPPWIDVILVALNQFFDTCRQALTRQLTFDDNFDSQPKTIRIVAGATAADNKFRFAITMSRRPRELIIVRVENVTTTYAPLTSAPWADWHLESNEVVVDSFLGLTSGQSYDITVRIF